MQIPAGGEGHSSRKWAKLTQPKMKTSGRSPSRAIAPLSRSTFFSLADAEECRVRLHLKSRSTLSRSSLISTSRSLSVEACRRLVDEDIYR